MTPPFLLFQARDPGDPMLEQERRCFARTIGVDESEIDTHNVALRPPSSDSVHRHRALLIGGSGDYLVSKRNLPRFDDLLAVFRDIAETGFPTFASCFGFQILVEALGGRVVLDTENAEVGTYEMRLTAEGEADPLVGILPPRFLAQQGHKDRAERLPPEAIHLASSRRSPFQAFRLRGKPVWATQFHPELTFEDNRARFESYRANYRDHLDLADDGGEQVSFVDSPEPARLLPEFVRQLG